MHRTLSMSTMRGFNIGSTIMDDTFVKYRGHVITFYVSK